VGVHAGVPPPAPALPAEFQADRGHPRVLTNGEIVTQTVIERAEARVRLRPSELVQRYLGLAILALGLLWVVLEAVGHPSEFTAVLLQGITVGALYALIALGYTLVYGIIELINFSHGDLFMLSTVLSGFFAVTLFGARNPTIAAFAVVGLGLIVSMVAAAGLNMLAERVAYRRLRRAPKLAPLITAVGLSFIYQWGGITTNGSGQRQWDRILGDRGFSIGSVEVTYSLLVVIGVTIPLLLLMTYVVQRTRQGKAMRAVAQDQDAARLMGIDVDRTVAFTFAVGGALAGAAGMLFLQAIGTTRYDAGFRLGLVAFTAAVLGGIGNLNGAVLGGFLIGVVEKLNEGLGLGQAWSQTVIFTILILLMVFKPEGILGTPTTEKV
jgi:branched-chain amino acid transport system permease protein